MSYFDCRLCVYYTWEDALLCAVDPVTAKRGDATNCREFEEHTFLNDGIVVKEIVVDDYYDKSSQYGYATDNVLGGYAIAVSIDGWQYLTCGVQCFIHETHDFSLEQGELGVTVHGQLLWQDASGRLAGYAEAWQIDHKEDEYNFGKIILSMWT